MPPGTKVTLTYLRSQNGKKPTEQTATVVLGTLPSERTRAGLQNAPDESNSSNYDSLDGVEVADIDADTRQQYGIPSSIHGAVVTSADGNLNLGGCRLREGDVIQEINRQSVRSADEAVKASDKASTENLRPAKVWRINGGQGASLYITVDNAKKK